MPETYPGILRADRIEWTGQSPDLASGQSVRVHVTLLDQPTHQPSTGQGQQMADALERVAALASGGLPDDPISYQREMRDDRPLPERAE